MQATPISRRKSKKNMVRVIMAMEGEFLNSHMAVDSRNIRRCPAVSLAASRSPRAMGCAKRLRVSIMTIRGIKKEGVPWGTRWLRRLLKAR